jgi:hypothetical protein
MSLKKAFKMEKMSLCFFIDSKINSELLSLEKEIYENEIYLIDFKESINKLKLIIFSDLIILSFISIVTDVNTTVFVFLMSCISIALICCVFVSFVVAQKIRKETKYLYKKLRFLNK